MIALVISLALVVPFAALFFGIGVAWERTSPSSSERFLCQLRHPSNYGWQHSPRCRRSDLRLVRDAYDWGTE